MPQIVRPYTHIRVNKHTYKCTNINKLLKTRVAISGPRQIPQFFQVFPTEALIFIKPPEVHRQTYMYSWVNIVALLAVHLVQSTVLNSTQVVYFVTITTAVAHHRKPQFAGHFTNFPDFSRTDIKFRDFPCFPAVWPPCHIQNTSSNTCNIDGTNRTKNLQAIYATLVHH